MDGVAISSVGVQSFALRVRVEGWIARVLVLIPVVGIVLGSISKQTTDHAAVGLGDEAGYYAWQQSWVTDFDCDPTDDFKAINTFMFPDRVFHGGTWRTLDKYPTGLSQLIVLFTAPAHALIIASNRFIGTHFREDGLSEIEVRTAWLAISGWCVLGSLALFAATRSVAGALPAAIATCCVWAGTSAFAYTWKLPLWCHGASFATVSIAAYFILARSSIEQIARSHWKPAAGAGLFTGLALVVRPTNVAVLLPLLLVLVYRARQSRKEHKPFRASYFPATYVLAFLFSYAIPIGIEMLTRKLAWGTFFFNGYAYKGEHFDWAAPHAMAVMFLFDTGMYASRGIFAQHPITIVSLMGLLWCALRVKESETRLLAIGWLLALAGTIYLYGCWWFWNLGWSYGARWSADFAPAFAIGAALLMRHPRVRPMPALAFLTLLAAWSVVTCV